MKKFSEYMAEGYVLHNRHHDFFTQHRTLDDAKDHVSYNDGDPDDHTIHKTDRNGKIIHSLEHTNGKWRRHTDMAGRTVDEDGYKD